MANSPDETVGLPLSEEGRGQLFSSLIEQGWPDDIVEQIRQDHTKEGHRVYAVTTEEAARLLGISRYGVEKLIRSGAIRRFTLLPIDRKYKPAVRIPVKDLLELGASGPGPSRKRVSTSRT